MELDEAIVKFGGKAGQLMVLKEEMPELPIPKFTVIKNKEIMGDWNNLLDIVKKRIQDLSPPYIVRGSNPDDHFGLEGILPTYPIGVDQITTAEDVRHCASSIAGHYQRGAMTEKSLFGQYQEVYGPTSNVTHGLIMHKNPSHIMLIALRHPHNPNILQLEFVSGSGRQRKYLVFQYDTKENIAYRDELSRPIDAKDIFARSWVNNLTKDYNALFREVVNIIRVVEESGKITLNYAQYFEFGFDHLGLFQVRPSMPYSDPKFDLDVSDVPPERRTNLCFGQTSPKGIKYYYTGSTGDSKNSYVNKGYFNFFTQWDLIDFRGEAEFGILSEAKFQKQRGFAIKGTNTSFLAHCLYRFLKRSEVALIGVEEAPPYGEAVKIISNGINAALYF